MCSSDLPTRSGISCPARFGPQPQAVLPDEKEGSALDFVKRKRGELREHLKKNIKIKIIPFIDVQIDRGEKNRQKIEELLRKK